jgi:hypothetical protein
MERQASPSYFRSIAFSTTPMMPAAAIAPKPSATTVISPAAKSPITTRSAPSTVRVTTGSELPLEPADDSLLSVAVPSRVIMCL